MTQKTEQSRRAKLYSIAQGHGLSDQQADELVHLFVERFPNEPTSSMYVDTWSERLQRGVAIEHADAETKKALESLR